MAAVKEKTEMTKRLESHPLFGRHIGRIEQELRRSGKLENVNLKTWKLEGMMFKCLNDFTHILSHISLQMQLFGINDPCAYKVFSMKWNTAIFDTSACCLNFSYFNINKCQKMSHEKILFLKCL